MDKVGNFGKPQTPGGWGLKNIHNFSKALVVKTGWRLITIDRLLTKVVHQKYIFSDSIMD